jgi:hypothetical protein
MKIVSIGCVAIVALVAACGGDEQARHTPTSRDRAAAIASAPAIIATPRPSPMPPTPTPTPPALRATMLAEVPVRVGPGEDSYVLGRLPAGTAVTAYGETRPNSSPPRQPVLVIPGVGWVTYEPALIRLSSPIDASSKIPRVFGGSVSPSYPPGKRTGVAEVDSVLDLVERRDIDALRGLARRFLVKCDGMQRPGLGGPRECPPGVPDLTPIPTFFIGYCHGVAVDPDRAFESLDKIEEIALFAVKQQQYRYEEGITQDGFDLLFTRKSPAGDGSFSIDIRWDGVPTGMSAGCGSKTAGLPDVRDYLLPPMKPPQLR